MKLLLSLGLAVGLLAMASALTCKICSFRALSICFTSSKTETCAGNCSYTKASLGDVSLFTKQSCESSCISSNGTKKDDIFSIDYVSTCCNTDLCNGGNSVKISLSLGLGMALLWLLNAL
ncbi:ly-6/neurotoxin-like protein 1 [Rhinophrynus dorsalis]